MTDMGSLHWKSRALAAEADCKRLQDEAANLDAARREAEAAAAEMREALARRAIERHWTGDGEHDVGFWQRVCVLCRAGTTRNNSTLSHAPTCLLSSLTPGAALLAELEDWRRLKDPAALVVNLLRGTPAALTRDQFLHLAGATDYPALLAERDRLREALEEIAAEHDAGRHDGLPEPCPALDADTMFALARAALKETSNG